jgi:hypothetical protein
MEQKLQLGKIQIKLFQVELQFMVLLKTDGLVLNIQAYLLIILLYRLATSCQTAPSNILYQEAVLFHLNVPLI